MSRETKQTFSPADFKNKEKRGRNRLLSLLPHPPHPTPYVVFPACSFPARSLENTANQLVATASCLKHDGTPISVTGFPLSPLPPFLAGLINCWALNLP